MLQLNDSYNSNQYRITIISRTNFTSLTDFDETRNFGLTWIRINIGLEKGELKTVIGAHLTGFCAKIVATFSKKKYPHKLYSNLH